MNVESRPCYTVYGKDRDGFLWALKASDGGTLALDREFLAGRLYSDGTNVLGTNRARLHVHTPLCPLPSGAYVFVSKKPLRFVEIEDKPGVGPLAFKLFFNTVAAAMDSKFPFRLFTARLEEQTCWYRLLNAVFGDVAFNEVWFREALGPFPKHAVDLPFVVKTNSKVGPRDRFSTVDPALFVVRYGFVLQMPRVDPFKAITRVEA